MNFASVAPNKDDAVVIPDGYQQAVVISWGDPVLPGAPAFDVKNQSAAAQRQQFGFNNDFAGLLPIEGSPDHYLLVVNHEYTTERFMFPGYDAEEAHPRPVRDRRRRTRTVGRRSANAPRRDSNRSWAATTGASPATHRSPSPGRPQAATSSRPPPTRPDAP